MLRVNLPMGLPRGATHRRLAAFIGCVAAL